MGFITYQPGETYEPPAARRIVYICADPRQDTCALATTQAVCAACGAPTREIGELVDDRTPEEKAAAVARMRAWLDNLPPPLANMYADLKRMDPKGLREQMSGSDDRPDRNDSEELQRESASDPIAPEDR